TMFDQGAYNRISAGIENAESSADFEPTLSQARQVVDAVLSGDPSRLGTQEQYASTRAEAERRVAERRERLRAIREGLDAEATGSARSVTDPASARKALIRLRDRALAAAMATGDADLFRRTMATYRERLAAVPLGLDDTRFSLPM